MKVAWEEPFGPVLPIIRVTNVEEAIAFANESEFGLNLQSLQMISKRPLKLLKNLKWVQFILIIKPNVVQIISPSLVSKVLVLVFKELNIALKR